MNACASDASLPVGRRKAPAPAFGNKTAPAAAAHTQTVPDFFTGMRCTALHLMQHPCLLSALCRNVAALSANSIRAAPLLLLVKKGTSCKQSRVKVHAEWPDIDTKILLLGMAVHPGDGS